MKDLWRRLTVPETGQTFLANEGNVRFQVDGSGYTWQPLYLHPAPSVPARQPIETAPDGPEATAEIERLRRDLKKMFLSWHAADMQAGENWAKLKLAREGLQDIKADCQGPTYGWVEARAERILKAIGGDD